MGSHWIRKANPRLVLILIFLLQFFVYQQGWLRPSINYRLVDGSLLQHGLHTAAKWKGLLAPDASISLRSDDDPGPVLVMASILHLTQSADQIKSTEWMFPPNLYFFLMSLPYLIFLILISWTGEILNRQKIFYCLVGIVLISNFGPFLAFAGDVYYFPVMSVGALLWWYAILARRERYWFCGLGVGAILYFSDIFRSSGILLLPAIISIAIFPTQLGIVARKQARLSAVLLILTFCSLKVAFAPPASHPIWHSIHAGFFEFGGWVDQGAREAFPDFMRKKTESSVWVADWDDRIQEMLVQKIDPTYRLGTNFQPKHDEYLREQVIGAVREHPFEIGHLLVKRIWQMTYVNPWVEVSPNSRIQFSNPITVFFRAITLLVVVAALAFGAFRQHLFRFAILALPVGVPALVVHSGYLIYSAPVMIVGVFLLLLCLERLIDRFSGRLPLQN